MIKYFVLITLFISTVSFIDGGDGGSSHCIINDMDITHNLFYNSVDGVLDVLNKKGKIEKYEVTTNISIYDIKTGKTSYLFSDSLKERIEEFYFESHYDALNKRMAFNHNDPADYQYLDVIGNFNLESRPPSDKLFIITNSPETGMRCLWMADKTGAGLMRVHEFNQSTTDYYFDVKNMVVRFVKQVGKKIETLDIKY